jgi:nucleoside-diphosphate-sugar epimerase
MKILITGANGSLGYHLVENLKAKNEAEREEFFQINTEATKYLYQLALKKDISHFIFISTISLYGKEFTEAKENSSLDYKGKPYAERKYIAEKAGLDIKHYH